MIIVTATDKSFINKDIDALLARATEIAKSYIIKTARKELKRNGKLEEFIMAMGSCFFTLKGGNTAHGYKCKKIDDFLLNYDGKLHITGIAMRFTVEGNIIEDW